MSATHYLEKLIMQRCIKDLLAAGYQITVNDGEEDTVVKSENPDEIFSAMYTTDEDYLIVHERGAVGRAGWVRFIYGNDGWDVVNDYTTNLESALSHTFALVVEMNS